MPREKNTGLKEKCRKFYVQWTGERVGFATFYNRIREDPKRDMAEAISQRRYESSKRRREKFIGQFAEEMERWFYHPDPKAGRQVFYGRLKIGYPKEIAILTGEAFEKKSKDKPKKPARKQNYIEPIKYNVSEEQYTGIDITYPKEVARVFRKEFCEIISDLERKLTQVGEKDDVKVLNDKLEFAKAELELFNSYNPR